MYFPRSFFCRPVFCAAITALSLMAFPAIAQAQFETRATDLFPEGETVSTIALGDFNHDGKLDVVMIVINGFAVALGNGDGTFQAPVMYTTAELTYSLAVADFNGDGNLDIVTADEDLSPSTVSVYLGNGDGTFQTKPITSATTSYSEFIAVGDLNNDGKPDIVVIENPYISVLLGNGDGTFGPPSDNSSFVGAHWLAVADFNNDHKLDVLVTGYFGSSDSIGVLLGNGNGTLQNSITSALQFVPSTVAAGDLNRDGKMDAVLGYDLDGIAVLLGNGDGTLQSPVNYNTTGLGGGEVVVDDFNRAGKLDVAVVSSLGNNGPVGVDVLWGNGDGTLQPAQLFESGVTGSPVVGDLNGDHLPDLALGNYSAAVVTMLNTGAAAFSPTAPLSFPAQLIDTKSSSQTVTLTNSGKSVLTIGSIKASGAFKESTTCGKSLKAGAKCSINVLFQPTTTGSLSGLVTINDSASSKPQYIELQGNATAIRVSPSTVNFGTEKVGTKSPPQTVTATNVGSSTLTVASLLIDGQQKASFSQTNNCTAQPLQPGASCTATVIFDPATTGALSADLYFTLKGQGAANPQPVILDGTGD